MLINYLICRVSNFDPNASGTVNAIAVQSDGRILIGGSFSGANSINGTVTRNRIARLETTGAVDAAFDPNANNIVFTIAVQSDGRILIGGDFNGATALNGTVTRNRIARLETTGVVDAAFDPNANNTVLDIAVQSDGKVLIGGSFAGATAINGNVTRNYFARLSNDTAALSALTVTKTTVTLTRNGSAAQFNRVIFEQSTDNGATYTTLGTATNSRPAPAVNDKAELRFAPNAPTAAGYTLTGLNLPSGQNILIRARGFYRTGFQNASETIEDKVQNAFLPLGTTAASVNVSGRVLTPEGRGLTNASVTLTDTNGITRTTRTSSFGYYHFTEVAAGQTYIIAVRSKRYEFAPQIVTFNEDVNNLNFFAGSLQDASVY